MSRNLIRVLVASPAANRFASCAGRGSRPTEARSQTASAAFVCPLPAISVTSCLRRSWRRLRE